MADRILGDLHEHRVARFERQLDAARLPFEAGRVPVHLTGIQHAVAGLADVDERRLHARQHVLHAAEVDVADRGDLLDVGDVMLDEHVVLDDGDLRVMAAFAHHHETVHVLAAREEVLLDQLALAAALAAVVAAALLLRLQSGGALDVGDLVDVLLLARAAHGHLIVTLLVGRAGAATATATGDVGVIVFFLVACAAGRRLGRLVLLRRGLAAVRLAVAAAVVGTVLTGAATATGSRARILGGLLVVDRRIGNAVELQVLLDLLHFGGRTALLRVQATVAARRTHRFVGLAGFVTAAAVVGIEAVDALDVAQTVDIATGGSALVLVPLRAVT